MKLVVTTVNSARVEIKGKVVGSIQKGILVLVGFTLGDDKETVTRMVDKLLSLRIFADENRQINLSLSDVRGGILSVSQFTLYANVRKGRRPSFTEAMRPNEADVLYQAFNQELENKYGPVSTGVFGADMQVYSDNDGPFTLILDSKELFL